MLQVAALAFAVALAGIYAVRTLEGFGVWGFAFGERLTTFDHALVILSYLLTLMGVVQVASAFAPRKDYQRRNRRLGWGAAVVAAGGAVALLYYALPPWRSGSDFIPFDWARPFSIGDFFFWTLAFGTAAWAFFLSVGDPTPPAHSRFARREGLLTLACVWLCLSYACALVEVFAVFFRVGIEDAHFIFDYTVVLRALGAVAARTGAVLAVVDFGRSRRSFL